LKSLSVMFPTMGHICLAPFVSQITRSTGRKKPALHLQGPSGCGKSFIGTLAMSFFGNFDDQVQSWESTKNAIEKEGFYFRDALYVVDDFKLGCIDPKVLIEVIQHYADGHGRSRLKPDTKMGNLYSIRGLLTSTGENFVSGVESVSARTIVIKVEPEINRKNGTLCWQSRGTYKAFLPYLIYNVISDHKWKDTFCSFVNDYTDVLVENVNCLSNGLRISSNWALNAWGFRQFTKTLVKLGVIDNTTENSMLNHYDEIAAANIRDHATRIVQENPVNVFFETIGQAIAAGEAQLHGMKGVMKSVQPIGKVKLKEGLVYIVPDAAIEVVIERFKTIGQKYPFTKNSLRDALAGQGMISKVKDGRWTVQVRFPDGTRHQAWEINLDEFKKWSGI
ncbi:MAG: DUF927 domain-containing protein, partial [Deltaproteobacteria bacterium]